MNALTTYHGVHAHAGDVTFYPFKKAHRSEVRYTTSMPQDLFLQIIPYTGLLGTLPYANEVMVKAVCRVQELKWSGV